MIKENQTKEKKKKRSVSTRVTNRIYNAKALRTRIKSMETLLKKEATSVANFQDLLDQVVKLNIKTAESELIKKEAVALRQEAYNGKGTGLMPRLAMISQYFEGRSEIEARFHEIAKSIIKQMRNSRKKQKEFVDAQGENASETLIQVSNHTSTYGHRVEGLQYLISLCKQLGDKYDPGNKLIELKALKSLYTELDLQNENVETHKQTYSQNRKELTKFSKQCMKSARHVRKLVKATYQAESKEYDGVQQLDLN
ncbi:MAG: hypothetical protein OIF50_01500 [Flavobacteriaceae bacterium]|nr:hypothetical protein [Flavobacteriaceae bacterium]